MGRFRLFFRYDSRPKVVIFAGVNDDTALRTYGSKSDDYGVFKSMLDKGNPPDDWNALLKAASDQHAKERLARAKSKQAGNKSRCPLPTQF